MFWKKRSVWIEIGFGEALDRLSILSIKCEKFDGAKKVIVDQERKKLERRLKAARIIIPSYGEGLVFTSIPSCEFYQKLCGVNQRLWEVENEIRQICECVNCSEEELAHCRTLTKSVYVLNDIRSELKKQIDNFLGSSIMEIKDYRGKQND